MEGTPISPANILENDLLLILCRVEGGGQNFSARTSRRASVAVNRGYDTCFEKGPVNGYAGYVYLKSLGETSK